jgi:hypothetical protein
MRLDNYEFPSIFTMLFLRKTFWMTTINAFFIFHTPFSIYLFCAHLFCTHLFCTHPFCAHPFCAHPFCLFCFFCPFCHLCHYGIMTEIYKLNLTRLVFFFPFFFSVFSLFSTRLRLVNFFFLGSAKENSLEYKSSGITSFDSEV